LYNFCFGGAKTLLPKRDIAVLSDLVNRISRFRSQESLFIT